jgi:hypothetical protein
MVNKKLIPYQIAVVGPSGKGKTMSFRNMNPETCGYINMEGKPLPFINKFKHYCIPNTWQECYSKLIEYAKSPEITEVVLDSFSAYVDSLLETARKTKKGFDTWNMYNEEIGKLLYLITKYPKDIIVTGHSANVESDSGVEERRIAVKGNEWNKAGVESKFTIVLYADVRRDPLSGKANYILNLNSDGVTSAKTPPMFIEEGEDYISNDANAFLQRVRNKLSNG